MASIYQRRLTWWIQFYHPLTGKLTRETLDTHGHKRARAELPQHADGPIVAADHSDYVTDLPSDGRIERPPNDVVHLAAGG